jgi:hypothetical protein
MAAQAYVQQSVAPNTRYQYLSKIENYNQLCKNLGINPTPISQEKLIIYATHLAQHISHQSIKCHLSAIKYYAQVNGQDTDFTTFSRLFRLMNGIKRVQAQKFSKPKRIPITPPLLYSLRNNLFKSTIPYEDKLMLWAAMLTAFFGFLRISEYTSTHARTHDPTTTLCRQDITIISPMAVDIRIKASKTDPFRVGTTIRLIRNNSPLCPIVALFNYKRTLHLNSGPLFTFHDGRYLTRRNFSSALNKIKPPSTNNLSSHSFRIGAATTAAAAGLPRWLIQALGRWTSDCYKTYLRISDHTKNIVSQSLANTMSHSTTFDPDNISH